jgi:hypothetical protein
VGRLDYGDLILWAYPFRGQPLKRSQADMCDRRNQKRAGARSIETITGSYIETFDRYACRISTDRLRFFELAVSNCSRIRGR